MVAKDTVIPIKNGFYTIDKLNPKQDVHGANGLTFLNRIDYAREYGIIVTTEHYEVIVSADQQFIEEFGPKMAGKLMAGDKILTSEGYESVVSVGNTEEIYDMFYVATEDGTFQANGFYLTNNSYVE